MAMALRCLRLRRTLTSISPLRRISLLPSSSSIITRTNSPLPPLPQPSSSAAPFSLSQCRTFSQERKFKLYQEGDEITEDTILFPGCDYNHWLITVDFPRDPAQRPSDKEMVETYERICAQGLNISIEEAKKKIYACSTTTYQGFQAVMTEEESEKFKDVPGVVFVLPDSYIDPVNQQYGGDKYENGVITPRPPPYQNRRARQSRYSQGGPALNEQPNGRYSQQGGDPIPNRQRNAPYDQQAYMQGGPVPNQPGNTQYDQKGYAQGGGRNFGSQQGYLPKQRGGDWNFRARQGYPPQQQEGGGNLGPQQDFPAQQQGGGRNFGPRQDFPAQQQGGGGNFGPRQDYPPQQRGGGGNFSPQQDYSPQQQGDWNFGPRQDYQPQQNYGPPGGHRDRMPMNNKGYDPAGRDTFQAENRGPYNRDDYRKYYSTVAGTFGQQSNSSQD